MNTFLSMFIIGLARSHLAKSLKTVRHMFPFPNPNERPHLEQ